MSSDDSNSKQNSSSSQSSSEKTDLDDFQTSISDMRSFIDEPRPISSQDSYKNTSSNKQENQYHSSEESDEPIYESEDSSTSVQKYLIQNEGSQIENTDDSDLYENIKDNF